MRVSIRRGLLVALMAAAMVCMVVTYLRYDDAMGGIRSIPTYTRLWFEDSDSELSRDIHVSNYKYGDYDRLAAKFDLQQFKQLPRQERCVAFFRDLLETNPDWELRAFDKNVDVFDRRILDKQRFFREEIRDLRDDNDERKKLDAPGTKHENATVEGKFQQAIKKTLKTEQKMADSIAVARIYQKCFVEEWVPASTETELYDEMTKKVLPFLTNALPTFTFNNSTITNGFPVADDFASFHEYNGSNLVEFIKTKSNGKGIVLSASSKHGRDVVKLIHLLRALDNTLPIQIIHRDDFSKRNRDYVEFAATADKNQLLKPRGAYNWQKVWPEIDLLANATAYGINYTPQNVTFVNIRPAIKREFRTKFPGFSNKLLALFFTSFKEVLLVDADAIPLVRPNHFFFSQEYRETGTYFFKDRTLRDTNDYIETNFFAKLFPSANEKTLEDMFGVPQATYVSLANTYMAGYRHYQEAGIVAIDKVAHLSGVLMMFPLSLWKEPVGTAVWGEKEMYWLGLSMAGDENYRFNYYPAASVGQLTTAKQYSYYPDADSNEVCSTHPGHIDKYGHILWMNSGFSFCKKHSQLRDKAHFPLSEMDPMEVLGPLYAAPLVVTHAIIPPTEPDLRGIHNSYDKSTQEKQMDAWKSQKEIDDVDRHKQPFIKDRNPLKGWMKNPICSGYYYCAYDKITTFDKTTDSGVLVTMDNVLVEYYRYLGKAWLSGTTRIRK